VAQQGTGSWFCCGPDGYPHACGAAGSGACGTCDSPKIQAAWQYLNGFPTSYCGQTARLSCGHSISITAPCYFKGVAPKIADHGPGACTGQTQCDPLSHRVVDMTPATFVHLAPLSYGLITVFVYTY
jgi:hypothetical protein